MISSLISSIVQIHRRPKLEQFGFSKYDQVIYIHGQLVDEPKKYACYVCLIYMFFFMLDMKTSGVGFGQNGVKACKSM